MKNTVMAISILLNIVLVGAIGYVNLPDKTLGDTVESNIILEEGKLMIGNTLGYAEVDGNGGYVSTEYNFLQPTTAVTATTTLTTANAGEVIFLGASANMSTITLPAATDGLKLTFVVTGALTGSSVIIDSAEGDNINGILMVNDADVACEDEDQLNIITDGEVIGDRVEIISNGTGWYILDSDIDAAGKMTCTDPT